MKTRNLITRQQVLKLAFTKDDHLSACAIPASDIEAEELRRVIPVTGRALYEAMHEGRYTTLRDRFVAPVVAVFTRLALQPVFDVRTGRFGAVVPDSSFYKSAEHQKLLDMRKALREKGRALMYAMSDHLEQNAELYPEYRSCCNILKRCTTDGGIVQVR